MAIPFTASDNTVARVLTAAAAIRTGGARLVHDTAGGGVSEVMAGNHCNDNMVSHDC